MNLYKKKIYKNQLQHAATGQKWKNHKYLYIDGNGNYVYPEDVRNKAKGAATAAGTALSNMREKASNAIAAEKQKRKDRKFVKNSNPGWSNDLYNGRQIEVDKRNEERRRQHLQSKEYRQGEYNRRASRIAEDEEYKRLVASSRPGRTNTKELESQKKKTQDRKEKRTEYNRNASLDAERQRKSAHAGYEADRKKFPEGGSTEELERQKTKTRIRKNRPNVSKQIASAHLGDTIYSGKTAYKQPSYAYVTNRAATPKHLDEEMEKTKIRKTEKANLERRRKQKKAKSETPTRTISGVSTTTKSPTKKSRTSSVTVETTQPKQKNETAYERQHRERAESTKGGNNKLRKIGSDLTRAWMKSKFGGATVDSVDTLKGASDKSRKKKKKVAKK